MQAAQLRHSLSGTQLWLDDKRPMDMEGVSPKPVETKDSHCGWLYKSTFNWSSTLVIEHKITHAPSAVDRGENVGLVSIMNS